MTRSSVASWARRVTLVGAFLVVALALMTARTVLSGEQALRAAEEAFDRGDLRECVRLSRRAASLSVPGAPHVGAAFHRLVVVARGAEAAGQPELARLAWQAVRGAALDGRGALGQGRSELDQANFALARLEAAESASRFGVDAARLERDLARSLERPAAPGVLWLGVLGAGFFLSATGLGWAGLRGTTQEGGLSLREVALGLSVAVIGAACWTLAVYQA